MAKSAPASASISAAGTAQVSIGPQSSWLGWDVVSIRVVVTGSALDTEARVYEGGVVADSSLVVGTYSGNRDTSTGDGVTLDPGEVLIFRWTGGTPGAVATGVVSYNEIDRRAV